MAYTFVEKDFKPVGQGDVKESYKARQVPEETWKHENEAELLGDLLAITDGNFIKAQAIVLNAVNQYLRFKDNPANTDPMVKILAFARKAGLSQDQVLALLQAKSEAVTS